MFYDADFDGDAGFKRYRRQGSSLGSRAVAHSVLADWLRRTNREGEGWTWTLAHLSHHVDSGTLFVRFTTRHDPTAAISGVIFVIHGHHLVEAGEGQ
jgi:hypothetical protein